MAACHSSTLTNYQEGGSNMLKEFKEFIMRGNVIGLALGGVDFSNLFINLSGKDYASVAAAKAAGAPTFNYGIFFNTILNFLIIAFAIFLIIKQVNRFQKPAPAPATKDCPHCLSVIPIKATRCPHCTSELR